MVTTILILAALLVLVLVLITFHQMVTCPVMWVFHACTGTVTTLAELFVGLLSAIIEGIGGSNG